MTWNSIEINVTSVCSVVSSTAGGASVAVAGVIVGASVACWLIMLSSEALEVTCVSL